jgi:dTDP-4-amino-4,6-dideoxygalactose transaminase
LRNTFLPYCKPALGDEEIAAAAEAMRNGWVTTGPRTAAFEEAFARACEVPHAVALNSCTAGLHLALAALGVGPGDEVVTPSLTFAAGAQCAIELGAKPVFCDVESDTFSVSARTIAAATGPRTKAIIVMPYAGRPLGIEEISRFARERGIALIEDAAHAAGTLDRGQWCGRDSNAAIYSFYATKNLTTGEGGMLVTSLDTLAERIRRLSLHGMSRDAWQRYTDRGTWRYDVVEPGFKYNITDIASSIGLVQLRRIPELQARREAIADRYLRELAGIPGLSFARPARNPGDRTSWCMFAVTIEPAAFGIDRDEFIERLRGHNIGTSVHYIPTHHFTAYRALATDALPNTELLAERLCSLPLYPSMTDTDVDDVIDAVRSIAAAQTKPIRIA